MKLRIGLYGTNGHQIQGRLVNHPKAELTAVAAVDPAHLPPALRSQPGIRHHRSLDELLADDRVDLVSFCSPCRRDQAAEAGRCLRAGKHAYAEKPAALTETELDALVAVAAGAGREFHEMAGTAFDQPYLALRGVVQSGVLGDVVQVIAQKSYPYHDRRPQDEDVDGGLLCQAGIHAFRYIEHVAGQRIRTVCARDTRLGNPGTGHLRMAASYLMELENGGVASVIANYLNPKGFGRWGNEHLRIFGTRGFVESTDGGVRTRLVVGDQDRGSLTITEPGRDYFDFVVDHILDGAPMPFTLDEELHPLRMVIRARHSALALGQ